MKIEYLTDTGHINYKIGSRITLAKNAYSDTEGKQFPADDVSEKPAIIQSLSSALWELPPNPNGQKIIFSDSTCTIQAGSDKITPDTDLSPYPEEVKVFARTIYSFDNGRYAEIYRLSQLEDEPDTPVTVAENVYDADGVTVVDRKEIPVMETVIEPVDVKMEGKWMRLNRPVERQKVRTGRKVSDADKQRLQELRSKTEPTESPTR